MVSGYGWQWYAKWHITCLTSLQNGLGALPRWGFLSQSRTGNSNQLADFVLRILRQLAFVANPWLQGSRLHETNHLSTAYFLICQLNFSGNFVYYTRKTYSALTSYARSASSALDINVQILRDFRRPNPMLCQSLFSQAITSESFNLLNKGTPHKRAPCIFLFF